MGCHRATATCVSAAGMASAGVGASAGDALECGGRIVGKGCYSLCAQNETASIHGRNQCRLLQITLISLTFLLQFFERIAGLIC